MQLSEYLIINRNPSIDNAVNFPFDMGSRYKDEKTLKEITFLIKSEQYKVRIAELLGHIYHLHFVKEGILHAIHSRFSSKVYCSASLNLFFQEIVNILYTKESCNVSKFGYMLEGDKDFENFDKKLDVNVPYGSKALSPSDEVLTILKRVGPEGLLTILNILNRYYYIDID